MDRVVLKVAIKPKLHRYIVMGENGEFTSTEDLNEATDFSYFDKGITALESLKLTLSKDMIKRLNLETFVHLLIIQLVHYGRCDTPEPVVINVLATRAYYM